MSSEKSKVIGKFIVILLCCAILFFLLLPFLDGSAQSAAQNRTAKKAHPQIFTTNPLHEMAQKILTAFGRKPKHHNAFSRASVPAETAANQAAALASPITRSPAPSTGESVSFSDPSANFTPDGSQASFFSDEGEWVLINQTEPVSSNRGMHDINSSDSAYDKLIRLERQAKYTGRPRPQSQSTWARVWQPSREIFSRTDTPTPVSTRQLGSQRRTTAPGTSTAAQPQAQKARTARTPSQPLGTVSNGNDLLAYLLNPGQQLDDLGRELKKSAHDLLPATKAAGMDKQIDQHTQQAKNWVNDQLTAELEQAAEGKDSGELITRAITCIDPTSSSLYKDKACTTYSPTLHSDQQDQQTQQLHQHNKQRINQEVAKMTGTLPQDTQIKTIVAYGISPAGKIQTETDPYEDDTTRIYYEFINHIAKSQGCDAQDCVWLSLDPAAQTDLSAPYTLQGAGTTPVGVPAKNLYKTFQTFQNAHIQNAASDEEANRYMNVDLKNLIPHAWPVSASQVPQFIKEQGPAVFVVTTNDGQGKQLHQYGVNPAQIVLGNEQIFTQSAHVNIQDNANSFTDKVIQQLKHIDQLTTQAAQPVVENAAKDTIKQSMQEPNNNSAINNILK